MASILQTNQDFEQINPYQYKANKKTTIANLIDKLNLKMSFFAILVDGKKASLDTEIDKTSEIVILPKIAGG